MYQRVCVRGGGGGGCVRACVVSIYPYALGLCREQKLRHNRVTIARHDE